LSNELALRPHIPLPETFEIERLQRENRQLQKTINDLEEQLRKQKKEIQRAQLAVQNLQTVLTPFRRAVQMIFGEIEAAGVPDIGDQATPATAHSSYGPQDAKWQPWIAKWQGTKKAVVIQTLLDHGPLTRTQLRSATESGWSTIDAITAQLQNLGLITKENEKWTLKNS
jgi:hypothetical protein